MLLLAVVVFNFILLSLVPGDIADTLAGESGGASQEVMDDIRRTYGLDRPFHIQLATYVGKVVQGDLGTSYYFNLPVTELILGRVAPTLLLVVTALVLAILIGTLFGVIASRRPNGLFSHFVTVLALVGFAAPVFLDRFPADRAVRRHAGDHAAFGSGGPDHAEGHAYLVSRCAASPLPAGAVAVVDLPGLV